MGRAVCWKGNQAEHKMKIEGAESCNVTHNLIAQNILYQNKKYFYLVLTCRHYLLEPRGRKTLFKYRQSIILLSNNEMYRVGTTFFISLQSICDHLNCVERCRTLHTYTCRSSHNLCPLQLEKLPFQKNQQLLITLYNIHGCIRMAHQGAHFFPYFFTRFIVKLSATYIYRLRTIHTNGIQNK